MLRGYLCQKGGHVWRRISRLGRASNNFEGLIAAFLPETLVRDVTAAGQAARAAPRHPQMVQWHLARIVGEVLHDVGVARRVYLQLVLLLILLLLVITANVVVE